MKKQIATLAAVCLVFGGTMFAGTAKGAQDQQNQGGSAGNGSMAPPNVLVIIREWLKPGMSGAPHEKSEGAFVQNMKQAKSPTHYFAMNSLSGPTRAEFVLGYDSFADWGKDVASLMGNSEMAQQFDQEEQADGKLLKKMDQGVFVYEKDKSVNPNVNVGEVHFWEITAIRIRPGHDADWDTLAKMHNSVFGNMPGASWAVWNKMFGTASGSVVIVTTPMKSLAEIDAHRKAGKQAWSQASADQKKQMSDLEASIFESIETNLYAVDPKMSYAADSWKTADPGFWGQQ